jgi:hypothetical protein
MSSWCAPVPRVPRCFCSHELPALLACVSPTCLPLPCAPTPLSLSWIRVRNRRLRCVQTSEKREMNSSCRKRNSSPNETPPPRRSRLPRKLWSLCVCACLRVYLRDVETRQLRIVTAQCLRVYLRVYV